MKRTLVGVGLLVAAGVGSVVMAPGGGAEEQPLPDAQWVELEAEFSPNPAEPGATVTLSSVDPCREDVEDHLVSEPETVALYSGGELIGEVDMNDDWTWSVELTAPEEDGTYYIAAECQSSTFEEELGMCGVDPEDSPARVKEEDVSADSLDAQNISFSRPAVPMWDWFNCEFEYYVATLTVGDEVPPTTPPTTAPESETPPPATPVVTPPDFTG